MTLTSQAYKHGQNSAAADLRQKGVVGQVLGVPGVDVV